MKVKEALIKVKNFLTRERWCKGAYVLKNGSPRAKHEGDDNCQFCLIGAMAHVSHGDTYTYDQAAWALHKVARDRGFVGIVNFNDDPQVTYENVVSLLDEAIDKNEN